MNVSRISHFGALVVPSDVADIRELHLEELRALVREHHLLVLRDFFAFDDAVSFADYCERWGEVSVWPFGKVLELVEQAQPVDHIFDNNYVPLHWDGMYRKHVPEFQIFHCVNAPAGHEGGRTTFSNTASALERAPRRARALWERVTGVYQRKMAYYDSKTVAPIVTRHPARDYNVIRYNEPPTRGDESFVNHPTLAFEGIAAAAVAAFHRSLRDALYAPESFYAHAWRTGDVVIADNYTLLHGREAFATGAPRHLRRVHVLGDPPLDNPHLVAYG